MNMEQYISTRKFSSKKALEIKACKVDDDVMQPGGALARQLNHDKTHCINPVICSVLACQIF